GHIVISYETYALVRDILVARALPADYDERDQSRGCPLCGRGDARRAGPEGRSLQRTHDGTRFLSRPRHGHCRLRAPDTCATAESNYCAGKIRGAPGLGDKLTDTRLGLSEQKKRCDRDRSARQRMRFSAPDFFRRNESLALPR